MRLNIIVLLLAILISLSFHFPELSAQEATITAGKDLSGITGVFSYSVGQVAFTAFGNSQTSINQGVQQTYEISTTTGVGDDQSINLKCSVYPNPTTEFLFLSIDQNNLEKLSYQLFNEDGRLMTEDKIIGNESSIFMSEYNPAMYFLHVITNGKKVKTFKIIKH